MFTIDTERNAAQGQTSVSEFLQKSAIAAETQITNQFGGFTTNGGTAQTSRYAPRCQSHAYPA